MSETQVVSKTEEQLENKQTEPTEAEKEALDSGWVPQDKWEGSKEDWVPANQYLKYGRLKAENEAKAAELNKQNKVIKAMKDHYVQVKEDAYKDAYTKLRNEKLAALEAEDITKALKIDDKIQELKDKQVEEKSKVVVDDTEASAGPSPEFREWHSKNSWYKPNSKDDLSQEADVLGEAYIRRNPGADLTAVFKYVEKAIKATHPEKFKNSNRDDPAGVVDSPNLSSNDKNNKTDYGLNEEEKAVAKNFGMTYKEYAEGKKK